jgi:hypothetical protein
MRKLVGERPTENLAQPDTESAQLGPAIGGINKTESGLLAGGIISIRWQAERNVAQHKRVQRDQAFVLTLARRGFGAPFKNPGGET